MARPCEYVATFAPLWTALRVFGVWPQRVSRGGRLVLSPNSLPGYACLASLVLSSWRTYVGFRRRLEVFTELPPDDFALWVLNCQFTIYLMAIFMIFFNIYEARRLSECAAWWHEFQPKLQRVCGARMSNPALRRAVRLTALATSTGWPLGILVLMGLSAQQARMSYAEVLFLAYGTTLFAIAHTHWRMHCAFWRHAAGMLRAALAKAVDAGPESGLDAEWLRRFVAVWVELRALLRAGLRAVELSSACNLFVSWASVVLCAYNIMYSAVNGFSVLGGFLSGVGVVSSITLCRVFNTAHLVNEELWTSIVRILSTVPLHEVPRDVLQELDTFRNILATKSGQVNLLGYLPINRATLGAIFVTMFSYLVVLIQFTVS